MAWFSFMWHSGQIKRDICFWNPPQNHLNSGFLLIFFAYSYWHLCVSLWKKQVNNFWRNLGCALNARFLKHFQYTAFCLLYYSACKKLQEWSLYEVKEDILLFVFNTKQHLRDIWLLSYKQNRFWCLKKKQNLFFFKKLI